MDPLRTHPALTTAAAAAVLTAIVIAVDEMPLLVSARSQLWGLGALHYAEFDRKLPARQNHDWYVGIGSLEQEAPAPVLQPVGGRFSGPIEVTANTVDGGSIHCSDDGSIPTLGHDAHTTPIRLRSTTVLRCRTFHRGNRPSITTTHTYLIDVPGKLPVLAMTVHPTNLWNKYTGIHARFEGRGSEWERDAHVEFFPDDDTAAFTLPGRLRIHGGWTRGGAKKSFRFYYTTPDGTTPDGTALDGTALDGRVAPSNLLSSTSPSTERTVIFEGGDRMVNRDELFQSTYAAMGGYTSASMPVHLYINGAFWGIYFVRERIDEEYLRRKFGPGDYDLLHSAPRKPQVQAGDRIHWDETIRFFEQADFTSAATLARAGQLIDLDNFTDYWLLSIYAAHLDWPHNNMYMFARREGDDRRWRVIAWDCDYTFDVPGLGVSGLTHQTLEWATRASLRHDLRFNSDRGLRDNEAMVATTLMLRRLLENAVYRDRFARRMSELLESQLQPVNVNARLDNVERLAGDRELDWDRWDFGPPGLEDERSAYATDLMRVRAFIEQRPGIVRGHVRQLVADGQVPLP